MQRSPLLLILVPMLLANLAAAQEWRLEGGIDLTARGIAYDAARDQLVAYAFDATCVHDGVRWHRFANPPALVDRDVLLAYDEERRGVHLFAGGTGPNGGGDTWEWDGAGWVLRNQDPQVASLGGFMVFDAGRRRLVRHGPTTIGYRLWEWDGAVWTPLGNSLQYLTGMVYDRGAGRLLGVEGMTLLQWTGTSWNPAVYGAVPSGLQSSLGLVFDEARNELLLITAGAASMDVRVWNGAQFVLRSANTPLPRRTVFHPVYDARRQRVVLHGGYEESPGSGAFVDTWHWDGQQWTEFANSAPVRNVLGPGFSSVAYDAHRRRLVHYQARAFGASKLGTYEWDGVRWQKVQPTSSPTPSAIGPLVYDSLRQRVILVASNTGPELTTWSYDGQSWTQIVTSQAPPDRAGHEIAYDAARDRIVLYGSGTTRDTWLFDGTDWQQATPANLPPLGTGHKLAYDPVRQQTVMFTVGAQTWLWTGTNWTWRATPPALTTRVGFGLTWDPVRQRIALLGGANPNYQPLPVGYILRPAEHWEWNGSAWSVRPSPGLPQSLSAALTVFEGDLVLVGGGQPQQTGALRRFVPAPAATATTFGSGCPGTLGVPGLAPLFVPNLGNTPFALRLSSLPPAAPAFAAFGFQAVNQPLGNGCAQLVGGALNLQVAIAGATGVADFPLSIPDDPGFLGLHILAQGAAIDANGAFAGIALSPGVDLQIGH